MSDCLQEGKFYFSLGFFLIAKEAEHADCDSMVSKICSYYSVIKEETRRILLSLMIHTNLSYEV